VIDTFGIGRVPLSTVNDRSSL